jgi:hypothetical protein
VKKRRKRKAAGDRRALALIGALAGACNPEFEQAPELEPVVEPDPQAAARERLAAYEQAQREAADFAGIPASDGRFGADPYKLVALPDGRVAGLLRGADRVVLLDRDGQQISESTTVHDPTDLAWHDGELLVVGTGEARIARYGVGDQLEPRGSIELPEAFALRAIAVGPDGSVVVADEGARLHVLRGSGDGLAPAASIASYCRGPIALEFFDDTLLGNCLLEHRIRFDRLMGDRLIGLGGITHDGPIWSFAIGPELDGIRLLALTGVENRPLDRSDGAFGYVDSYVFIHAFGPESSAQVAALNVSELGVVTPKWSRWLEAEVPTLELAGYATADLLRLRFENGLAAAPIVERRPGLPGTSAAVALADQSLLAANPLLDGWLRLGPDNRVQLIGVDDPHDTRNFEERLGEALVFTTAMAPWNAADAQRSRFTCETCHFEGRGDGRTHYTGREREHMRVHATSKPLFGLFPNRPYFSRALDRSMAQMVDNEFRVANRGNGRDPWFVLTDEDLPWLTSLPGWPGEVDGEQLRRALMAFLQRFSTPSNPAVRGREGFSVLEREGARTFADLCEGCHHARLVSDDPSTQIDPGRNFEHWERLIFASNGPIVWASADYVATEIEPHVHAEGARVPSLRRLYMKAPYFTNGSASTLAEVLAGVRRGGGITHGAGTIPPEQQLSAGEREALTAFLRLL